MRRRRFEKINGNSAVQSERTGWNCSKRQKSIRAERKGEGQVEETASQKEPDAEKRGRRDVKNDEAEKERNWKEFRQRRNGWFGRREGNGDERERWKKQKNEDKNENEGRTGKHIEKD